ncbi:MAG: hypothetical protein K0S51_1234 [Bacillales bacterium]|jgi:hypothetical protein|nr:hypothetical protein [Bacillales bacterium]
MYLYSIVDANGRVLKFYETEMFKSAVYYFLGSILLTLFLFWLMDHLDQNNKDHNKK